jgi:hypothetical protein
MSDRRSRMPAPPLPMRRAHQALDLLDVRHRVQLLVPEEVGAREVHARDQDALLEDLIHGPRGADIILTPPPPPAAPFPCLFCMAQRITNIIHTIVYRVK